MGFVSSAWDKGAPWDTSPLHDYSIKDRWALLEHLVTNTQQPKLYPHRVHACDDCGCTVSPLISQMVRDERKAPIHVFQLERISKWCCSYGYVLFDTTCACASDFSLLSLFGLTHEFQTHILLDHILVRGLSGKLPRYDAGFPVANALAFTSPRSSPDIFKRLAACGISISLPVDYGYDTVFNPLTLAWMIEQEPGIFPFGDSFIGQVDIDNLCLLAHNDHTLVHIAILVIVGGFHPSDNALSILMKTACLSDEPGIWCAIRRTVLAYIRDQLSSHHRKLKLSEWEQNYTSRGPSNNVIKTVVECCETSEKQDLVKWFYWSEDDWSVGTDVDLEYWTLYFDKHKLIKSTGVSRGDLRELRIDKRVIDFVFPRRNRPSDLSIAPWPMPQFSKPYTGVIRLTSSGDTTEIPVYLEKLVQCSEFLQGLTGNQGFKQWPGSDENVVQFDPNISSGVSDIHAALDSWIAHCYTGQLPFEASTNQIVDLYNIAWYLGDEAFKVHLNRWLINEYLTNFEHHQTCVVCPVCDQWKNM